VAVRTEWRDRVALVVLDRPERRNALDVATLTELRRAQREVAGRPARALVLTGAPPAFCAGADLAEVESGEFAGLLGEVLRGFGELPFVCIAAVDGPALGAGTQLAVACDLRVATPDSPFGIPAARLGLAVDQWTVDRLAGEAGSSVARAMLLAATTFRAAELVACGFIHHCGDLDDALAWAAEVAELAPLTVASHKLALERGHEVEAVQAARRRAWSSRDAAEGRSAFLAKRPPRFTGE
jgi:enoyl-CoA hydratase